MSVIRTSVNTFKWSILFKALENTRYGRLEITVPHLGTRVFKGQFEGPEANFDILDASCIEQLLKYGDVGLGESYIHGMWQTQDLSALLSFFVINQEAIQNIIHGKRLSQFLMKFYRLKNKNTKTGSSRNIKAHYDLGNDFYSLWLDPSMTYSSGIFDQGTVSLESAQKKKYDRILSSLPQNANQVLEIGCGWGGFSESAAQRDLKVDAITLSPSQAAYSQERLAGKGLNDTVAVKIIDYRNVKQKYDSIVSIEMFEAVGTQYWETYFASLKQNLKHEGKAVIQTITISDNIFEEYKSRTDFIQKHIFPGGVLPSKRIFNQLARKFSFNVTDAFEFGYSYKRTLEEWLINFDACKDQVKQMGFDDEFIRKWRFYLAYCIAGFGTNQTDVVQFALEHDHSA